MAIGASKMLLFGASAASVGGVSVGALLLPNMKGNEEKAKTTSIPTEKTEDVATPVKAKTCTIYVTDKDTGTNNTPQITKIISKNTDVKKFLEDKRSSNSQFAIDVESACSGNSPEKFIATEEGMDVYVYEKETGTWIYAQRMQKDWMKESSINRGAIAK
ncbi:hypothetical protein HF1_10600 [Mycoplasma haemofelis str. Langford 1]|uniref:Uncharacterized protein n=1 Tax=Mycoplasma haemofelis (strain Langford 1) TaxID=941640 RepID=E8ZIU7_MYCHL|nr:hypothetical protein [Mycoplasma haemofelis]CBY93068.1 hypothetical protein HF1_10600 [Mycoplasma haemofelis str. Langford 1]